MISRIKGILIISTLYYTPHHEKNCSKLGIDITYKVTEESRGLLDVKDFIGNDNVCLILGDNIFLWTRFN